MLFFSDLDNTLIYSYKHDIGINKSCVEVYEGREISFMTDKTRKLLIKISEKDGQDIYFVPTTTRTVAQYERIKLPIKTPIYALTCNGGVLLVNGIKDEKWYEESLRLANIARNELLKSIELLENDANRSLRVTFIEELFVYSKSEKPDITIKMLEDNLDTSLVDVHQNGLKVYVVPKSLDKGSGVKRLIDMIGKGQTTVAAGDSKFDIPMLSACDTALCPEELATDIDAVRMGKVFSDNLLDYVCKEFERCTDIL